MASSKQTLSAIFDEWSHLKLPDFKKELDTEAEQLDLRKTEAETSRKDLVAAVKQFRTNTAEDIRKAVNPILKRFRAEIDNLTARSKSAENAFYKTYKFIAKAPDPTPWLEAAASSMDKRNQAHDLILENESLKKRIEEYRKEFAQVKNQDFTIKSLKEQLKAQEEELDELVQQKVEESENKLQSDYEERTKVIKESEMAMKLQLDQTRQEMETLQAALDATQTEMLEVKARLDQERDAASQASRLLAADLESAQDQITSLSRELELERNRMSKMETESTSHSNASDVNNQNMTLLKEMEAKEREVEVLIDQMNELQQKLQSSQKKAEERAEELEKQLNEKDIRIMELKSDLTSRQDYDQIKKELQVFRQIEAGESLSSHQHKSLETLLLEKNRSLESQNTELRNQLGEATSKLKELHSKTHQTESQMQEHAELIVKLENELSGMSALGAPGGGEGLSKMSNIVQDGIVPSSDQSDAETLLPIITGQRDRFKLRTQELEAEGRHKTQSIERLKTQMDELRADNVKLYEKIKYMQSYPNSNSKASVGDVENRYHEQYEHKLDPFNSFHSREKNRRLQSMSPLDKLIFSMGRLILTSPFGRLFFVIYAFVLHFLVFLVLYKATHSATLTTNIADQCHKQYADHMHNFHHVEVDWET